MACLREEQDNSNFENGFIYLQNKLLDQDNMQL